jgi:hypothetical protein
MEPWGRQPGESSQAFHAFSHYRDLVSERSQDKAYREHLRQCRGLQKGVKGVSGRWQRWNHDYGWVSRVAAYDADLDRQQRQRREKELLEARDRHANLARLVQNKFLERMRTLTPEEIPVMALTQMLRVSTDVELRALGGAVESVKAEVTGKDGGPIELAAVTLAQRLQRIIDAGAADPTG